MCSLACGRQHSSLYQSTPEPIWQSQSEAVSFRVDPGQMEGAKAIGMTHVQAMINVILPQAFRNILPQIGNNLIINIKDTSVLSVISVVDLFFVHKSVSGALYTYFESATIVMAIYLTTTLITSRLLRLWEKKMDGGDNYELVDVMDIGLQLGKKESR